MFVKYGTEQTPSFHCCELIKSLWKYSKNSSAKLRLNVNLPHTFSVICKSGVWVVHINTKMRTISYGMEGGCAGVYYRVLRNVRRRVEVAEDLSRMRAFVGGITILDSA